MRRTFFPSRAALILSASSWSKMSRCIRSAYVPVHVLIGLSPLCPFKLVKLQSLHQYYRSPSDGAQANSGIIIKKFSTISISLDYASWRFIPGLENYFTYDITNVSLFCKVFGKKISLLGNNYGFFTYSVSIQPNSRLRDVIHVGRVALKLVEAVPEQCFSLNL